MASRLWVPVACGPLARYAAGCGSWLAERGYSRWTVLSAGLFRHGDAVVGRDRYG